MTTVNGIFMVDPTEGDITPDGDHNGGVDLRGGSQKSVKSRRSIGVISIFTDPNAAKEMAGDTEVTYEYETTTEERMRRVSSTTSSNRNTSMEGSNSGEFAALTNGNGPTSGGKSSVNGDKRAFEGDDTSRSNSMSRKATEVRKVGSFQMKSSYPDSSPARTPSTSAKNDDVFRAALENSLARRVKRPEGDTPQSSAITGASAPNGVRHKDVDSGATSQYTGQSLNNETEENNNVLESSLSTMHDFEKAMNEALKDMDDVVQDNYTESESSKSLETEGTPGIYRSRESVLRDVSRSASSVGKDPEVASVRSSKRESTTSETLGSYDISATSGDDVTGSLAVTRNDSSRSGSVKVCISPAEDVVDNAMADLKAERGFVESGDDEVTPVIYRSRESITRDVSRGGSTVGREAGAASAMSSKRTSTTSNVSLVGSYDINVPSDDNSATPVVTRSDSRRSDSKSVTRISAQDIVQSLMADATAQETGSVKSRDGDVTPVIYRSRESVNRDVSRTASSVGPEPESASGISSKRVSTTSVNREPGSYHMNTSGDNIGRLALIRNDSKRSSSVGVNRSSAQDIVQNLMVVATAQEVGSTNSGDGDVTPVIYRSRESTSRDVSRSASSVGKETELASGTSSKLGSTSSVNKQHGSFRMNTPSGGGDERPYSVVRTNSNRSGTRGVIRPSAEDVVLDFMTDTKAQSETGSITSRDGDVTQVIYRLKESVNHDVSRSTSSVGTEPETESEISSKRASRVSVNRGPGSFRMSASSGDNIGRLTMMRNDSSPSGSMGVNRSSAQDIVQNIMTNATDQASYAGAGFVKSVEGDVTPDIYRSRESSIRSGSRRVSSIGREPEPSSGKSSKRSSAMSNNTETGSNKMNAPSGGDDRSTVRNSSNESKTTGANRFSVEDIVQNVITDVKTQTSDTESWSVKSEKGSVTPDVNRSSENITYDVNGSASSVNRAAEAASGISSKRSSITSFNREPGSFRMNAPSGDNIGRLSLLRNDSSRSGSVDVNRYSASMKSGGGNVTEDISMSSESINRAEHEAGSGRSSMRSSMISLNRQPGLFSMNATSGDNTGRLAVTRSDSNRSDSVSRLSAQNIAHKQSTADTQSSSDSVGGSMTGINIGVTSSTDSTHVATAEGNICSTLSSVADSGAHLSQTSRSSTTGATDRDRLSVNSAALEPSSQASRETTEALPVAIVSPPPKPLRHNRPPGQFRTNIAVAYQDITTGRSGASVQQTAISRTETSGSGRTVDGPRSAKQMVLTAESTQVLGAESISGETQTISTSPSAVGRPTTLSLSRTDSKTSDVSAASSRRTADTGEAMVVGPTVLQNDEFKAKLSTLMGGLTPLSPNSAAASQSSSLNRRKRARTEPDAEFTAVGDSAKSYSTVPRDKAAHKPAAWTSPTSPVHEVRDLVREGTVGTLVKDVFKNMQLTGGCMDSSSMQRREKTLSSTGTTPTSAGFKFPIEGIDTPSAEPASFDADPPREEKVEEHADEATSPASAETVRRDMERRGFRPIIDMKMAGEIKKKALDLTSRKPHEAVETQVAEQRQLQDTATDTESDLLRHTRESLHKQVLQVGLNRNFGSTDATEDAGHGVVLRKTQTYTTEDATRARLSGSGQVRPESTAFSIVSAESGRDVTMEEVVVAVEATKDQKSSLHQQLLEFHATKVALSSGSVSEDTTSVRQVSDTEQGVYNGDSDSPEPERNVATEDNALEPATVYESSSVYAIDKRREQTTKDTFASDTENISLRAALASTKMASRSSTTGPDQKQLDANEEYRVESIDDTAATVTASQERIPGLQTANEDEPTIHSHSYYIETVLGDRPVDTNDKVTEQQYSDQTQAVVTTVQSSEQTTEVKTVSHRSSTGYDLSFRQIEVKASDGHDSTGVDELLSKLDGVDSDSASTLSDSHSSVTVIEKQPEDSVKRTDFEHTARDSTDQAVIDTILASGVLLSNEPPQFNGAYADSGCHLVNDTYTSDTNYWASDDRENTRSGIEQRPYGGGLIVRVHDEPQSHTTTYGGQTRWADSQFSTPRRSTSSSTDDESAAWSAVRVRYTRPHTRPQRQQQRQQQQRSRSSGVTRDGRHLAPQAARAQLLKPLTVEVNMDGRRAGDLSSSPYTHAVLDTPPARHVGERRPARDYKTVITQSGDGVWRASQREFADDYNGYYYQCEHLPTRQPSAVVVSTSNMRDGTRPSLATTKTRYLSVEESHTGRTPVRRHSARSRPATITQVRLDRPSDLETHSAYNEPAYRWTPTSGKYSVQRAMQDRVISTQHPDLRYRDQTSYTLNQSGSLGDLQDLGIDPQLRDADKRGDNYHITLNLKSTGTPSRPGSRMSRYVDETQIHDSSFGYVNETAPQYGDVIETFPVQYLDGGQAVTREDRIYAVQQVSPRPQYNGGYSVTRIHSDGISPPPPLVSACSSSNSSRQFEQNTSHYANGGGGGPKSNFSMQINQTMTMGYKPTDLQPPTPVQGPNYYVKSVSETHRDRVVMNGSSRRTEDDLEQYLSPVEDYNYALHSAETVPQVVRGNILIKNSIDTTSAPRVIDVVEADESEEVMVEDNVNPFHGHYFQSRENPMYSSDQDLSRLHREKTTTVYNQQRPARHLTNLFNNATKTTTATATIKKKRTVPRETGTDGFDTEIKVTKGYGDPKVTRSSRTERTTSGHNGYDATDYGRQTSSEFDVSMLLRNAPLDSIKQSIKVDREEEEIIGPLPAGDGGDAEDLLNFDTVSEKVDLGLEGGNAVISVRVRCERIVPIRGATDMFKKSSVIVTRIIEIDLQATEERRRLYQQIMRRTAGGNMLEQQAGGHRHRYEEAKLSTKDTFKLYKTFMGLAEADEGMQREKMTIDRTIEDERRPDLYLKKNLAEAAAELMDYDAEADLDTDELERRLEEELLPRYAPKSQEPDTVSYMSHVSEQSDLLY